MTRLVNLIGLFQWRFGGSEWSKGVCQCRDGGCFAWWGWGRVLVKHRTKPTKIIEPSRRFYQNSISDSKQHGIPSHL